MENIVYRTLEYIQLAMIGFGIEDFFIVHIFTVAVGHFNHSNFTLPLGPLKYIFNNPDDRRDLHTFELHNWLKISRAGNVITSSCSRDGVNWVMISSNFF